MDSDRCASAPPHWAIKSLGEVCTRVTSGGTPSRSDPSFYADGRWPWVKTQELKDQWIRDTEERITDSAVSQSSAKVLPENTILVAMYGATVGQLGILERPMTCNQACCALLVDPKAADYRYVFYQLLDARTQLRSLATGAAQQNLSGTLIRSLRFPFPPAHEQARIAQLLGTLDDKIELNRRMSKTLEEMARGLFTSWFVDFDPVRAKVERKDTGLPKEIADLFPDSFEDSELGEIPKGWHVGIVGDVTEVIGGTTPSTKEPAYWSGGLHAWATPKDLSALSVPVLLGTERQVTDAGLSQIGSGLLPPGTVLLSSRAPIGYLAITELPVAINQGFIAMSPKANVSNQFLLYWADAAKELILSRANGSTFLEISKSSFRGIPVVRPPQPVMDAFHRISQSLYRRLVECTRNSLTLAATRDTLLPQLISGALAVAEDPPLRAASA